MGTEDYMYLTSNDEGDCYLVEMRLGQTGHRYRVSKLSFEV